MYSQSYFLCTSVVYLQTCIIIAAGVKSTVYSEHANEVSKNAQSCLQVRAVKFPQKRNLFFLIQNAD